MDGVGVVVLVAVLGFVMALGTRAFQLTIWALRTGRRGWLCLAGGYATGLIAVAAAAALR
jgi:hypothetical protein